MEPDRQPASRRIASRASLAVGLVAFIGVSWLSFESLPERSSLQPFALLVLVPLALLTTWMNAVEFRLVGQLVDLHVGRADALRVAVYSSAANLLPLPGALVVRTARLRHVGYRRAANANLTAALAWFGVAITAAGGGLALTGSSPMPAAPGAAIGGIACVGASGVLAARVTATRSARAPWLRLLGCETAQVVIAGSRYLAALAALDIGVGVGQALVVGLAPVFASAVGLLPGGLGVREVLAGALAAGVDLPAASGTAATAVDRAVGLAALGAVSAVLLVPSRFAHRVARTIARPRRETHQQAMDRS